MSIGSASARLCALGGARVIYDLDAHEPLTETPWDDLRVRERIASIVEDTERSIADGVWPNHPQDDDRDTPLLDGLTMVYLGAAGMLWGPFSFKLTLRVPETRFDASGRVSAGSSGAYLMRLLDVSSPPRIGGAALPLRCRERGGDPGLASRACGASAAGGPAVLSSS